MSSLFQRHEDYHAADDVEGNAANSNQPSSDIPPPELPNLGEYPALDRYISTYREESRLAKTPDDAQSKTRSRKWWQFWKGSEEDAQGPSARGASEVPGLWLTTDINSGLSNSTVDERRKLSGWNELTSEKQNLFYKFITYFMGPILYGKPSPYVQPPDQKWLISKLVMEVAALLAVGLGDWIDFGVILGILFLNAFVGFYQEKEAADVVASLKGDIAMRCTVVRDGAEQNILARELVPGDIVCLHLFPTCPQDIRLLTKYNLVGNHTRRRHRSR